MMSMISLETKIGNKLFGDIRQAYENNVRAGSDVLPWDTFEAAAASLLAASDDLRLAISEVDKIQCLVIPVEDRHVGFQKYINEPTMELFNLTDSDVTPNFVHHSDIDFKLSYGKSKRNPLAKMQHREKEIRKAAAFLRRRSAELLPLCGNGWAKREQE